MRKIGAGLLLWFLTLAVIPALPSHAWAAYGGGGWHGGGGGWHGGGGWGGGGWHGGGGWNGGWHGGGWNGGWHGGGWWGWRGGVFIGGPWWWGYPYAYGYPWAYPYPYYGYYPPAYYSYPGSYPGPGVQGPSVYIQQQAGPSEALPSGFWYYCASSQAYYPNVQTCHEAWIKVPPAPH